ncbi:MAG: PAS domain-containing sensor histidine kinase [Vicinamibacteraceae bacterium]|nr:PAS domain-containing sensor histidine kinase [Vicinamibacteraceae bacterium]
MRLAHESRLAVLALIGAAPAVVTALAVLWTGDFTPKVQWTLSVLILVVLVGAIAAIRERVAGPLHTLANLLAALREGDFSIRARLARGDDPLDDVMREVNALTELLQGQRLDALDATGLLHKVMEEIDVAVFAFDGHERLQLANRAATRLIGQPIERLLGRRADELGVGDCLTAGHLSTLPLAFPGGTGRWQVRIRSFRQHGLPHQLMVLTDVSQPLREEERRAWQRLIRVLGHELNNSLAPIKSIAGSLEALLRLDPRPSDWEDDVRRGLSVVGARAESLSRFMASYARLAKLPPPSPVPVEVGPFLARVAALETRRPVEVVPGPPLTVHADADQLEQLLINLLRNAVDAAGETEGGVRAGWGRTMLPAPAVEIWVEDEGPGLSNPANLFVPFFTTKPAGTGIGLVLCRQIAEAHGGTVALENRRDVRGCRAVLRLPL